MSTLLPVLPAQITASAENAEIDHAAMSSVGTLFNSTLTTSTESADFNQSLYDSDQPRMSTSEAVAYAVVMSLLIVATIVGNVLVVLSVFTYGPLKTVPNFFVASLAGADLAVAVLVMPFNVVNFIAGHWVFGRVWCNAWLTFDILTCTASILHLCAIALDRYYAIHDPITYAIQRTRRRVVVKIVVVWTLSAVISVPPLIGWNSGQSADGTGRSLYTPETQQCELTNDQGFVLYSAAGSFYIPLAIMTVVYVRIFRATKARLRARAKATAAAKLRASKTAIAASAATTVSANELPVAAANSSALDAMMAASMAGIPSNGSMPHDASSNDDAAIGSPDKSEADAASSNRTPPACGMLPTEAISASHQTPVLNHLQVPSLQHQPHNLLPNSDSFVDIDEVTTVNVTPMPSPRPSKKAFAICGGIGSKRNTTTTSADASREPVVHSSGCGTTTNKRGVLKSGQVNRQLYEFMEEKQRISLSKERRAARTMAIIMGAFVACWSPFFLMYVIFPFCNWCTAATDFRVVNFIVWLGYINSALNPVIYTVFNVDFRRAFQNLLTGKCRLSVP